MFGFELDAVSPGRAILRRDARAHKQLNKVVHGGILAALADTAAAIADYLEAVPGGRIRVQAHVLRSGRNFAVTECEIFDGNGTLAAKALLTFGAAGGHSLQN
jgi:acyl-coenzyme A thioesterase PaaI-like protein